MGPNTIGCKFQTSCNAKKVSPMLMPLPLSSVLHVDLKNTLDFSELPQRLALMLSLFLPFSSLHSDTIRSCPADESMVLFGPVNGREPRQRTEAEGEWSSLCAGSGGDEINGCDADGGWRRSARVGQKDGDSKSAAPYRGLLGEGQRLPCFSEIHIQNPVGP